MASTVDELTINYFEGDLQRVKELDKVVLTKGAWSTIIYRYQDWNAKENEFGPERFSIRRYQKRDNAFQLRSKFNISSHDQAKKIIATLTNWVGEGGDK